MRRACLLLTLLFAPFARSQDPEPAEVRKDPAEELQENAKDLREEFAELKKAAERIPEQEKALSKEQRTEFAVARKTMFRDNASGRTWAPTTYTIARHLADAHKAQLALDKNSAIAETLDLCSKLMIRTSLLIDPKVAGQMPKTTKEANAQVRKAILAARELWRTGDKEIIRQFPALEEQLEEDPRTSHVTEAFMQSLDPMRLLKRIADQGARNAVARDASIQAAVALLLHWIEFGAELGEYAEELSK